VRLEILRRIAPDDDRRMDFLDIFLHRRYPEGTKTRVPCELSQFYPKAVEFRETDTCLHFMPSCPSGACAANAGELRKPIPIEAIAAETKQREKCISYK
jgi:hypothetical protein